MSESREYDLIICVVPAAKTQDVINAARGAGASGGTVISAAQAGEDGSFEQREVVMILVGTALRQDILQAIAFGAQLTADENGLAFSMPVDDVVGVVSLGGK